MEKIDLRGVCDAFKQKYNDLRCNISNAIKLIRCAPKEEVKVYLKLINLAHNFSFYYHKEIEEEIEDFNQLRVENLKILYGKIQGIVKHRKQSEKYIFKKNFPKNIKKSKKESESSSESEVSDSELKNYQKDIRFLKNKLKKSNLVIHLVKPSKHGKKSKSVNIKKITNNLDNKQEVLIKLNHCHDEKSNKTDFNKENHIINQKKFNFVNFFKNSPIENSNVLSNQKETNEINGDEVANNLNDTLHYFNFDAK